MYLFEQIDKLLEHYNYSRIMLAKKIDVPTATFNRYFSLEQEDKLRGCLWKIHKVFPEISRNWLFFDEGEMFDKIENNSETKKTIENLKNELQEERKLNRQLQNELIAERKISRELQAQLNTLTLHDKAEFQKIAN